MQDGAFSVILRKRLYTDVHERSLPRPLVMRKMKKIPPRIYMIMPTGISSGENMTRAAVSEISRISAPIRADAGKR